MGSSEGLLLGLSLVKWIRASRTSTCAPGQGQSDKRDSGRITQESEFIHIVLQIMLYGSIMVMNPGF